MRTDVSALDALEVRVDKLLADKKYDNNTCTCINDSTEQLKSVIEKELERETETKTVTPTDAVTTTATMTTSDNVTATATSGSGSGSGTGTGSGSGSISFSASVFESTQRKSPFSPCLWDCTDDNGRRPLM